MCNFRMKYACVELKCTLFQFTDTLMALQSAVEQESLAIMKG